MVDQTINTDTHIGLKRTHGRAFVIVALVAVAVATGFAVYYSNMVSTDGNGHLVVSAPDMSALKSSIVLKTPQGPVVAQIPQAAQPLPNGKTTAITDGFDARQRLQRDVEKHDRFDPIDRLDGKISDLDVSVKKQGDDLAAALKTATKSLADSLQAQADSQKAANADLATALKKVDGKVDDVVTRVSKLETAQATPAPAQPVAPQVAPQQTAPIGPMSQADPVPSMTAPAPQASIPTRTRMAASAGAANQDEMAAAAAAYKSLGPDLNGGHPLGHRIIKDKSEIGTGPVDACPPGQKRVITKSVPYGGFLNIRTECR